MMPEVEAGKTTQGVLPLSREDRLELIGQFRSAPIPGLTRLRQDNLADLLTAMEMNTGQADCRPSKQKLAGVLKIEVRTLERWLKAAGPEGRGLIEPKETRREGRIVIEVMVNWDAVRWHGETHFVPAARGAVGDTLFVHDRGEDGDTPFVHAPPGPAELTTGGSGTECPAVRKNVAGPATIVVGPATNFGSPKTEARAPARLEIPFREFPHSSPLSVLHKNPLRDPFSHSSAATDEARARPENAAENAAGSREPPHVWLSTADLHDPARLMLWARMAIARGWKLDFESDFGFLHWTFTAAASAWRRDRKRGGHVEKPVNCFVALVKNRWQPDGKEAASNEDDEWARRALRDLERRNFEAGDC